MGEVKLIFYVAYRLYQVGVKFAARLISENLYNIF